MSGWYLQRDTDYARERYWRMIREGRCTICGGVGDERALCETCAHKRKVYRATRETT